MDFTAPVIIVGPGRSGTTLLGSVLGEHPGFYMVGETQFLMQRMWRVFFEHPRYVNHYRFSKLAQQSRAEWAAMPWYSFSRQFVNGDLRNLGSAFIDIEADENARVARELGEAFAKMLIPPPMRTKRWGMQEIWSGSTTFPYSWDLYLAAFPNALYLQSIRHPLKWLRSALSNMGKQATREEAVHELSEWLKMVEHARVLRDTRRYMEFRHEDLVGDEGKTLARVFDFIGLDIDERCKRAMGIRYLPSSGAEPLPAEPDELIDAVPGLRGVMQRLGY
jgi:hypothetical protein